MILTITILFTSYEVDALDEKNTRKPRACCEMLCDLSRMNDVYE